MLYNNIFSQPKSDNNNLIITYLYLLTYNGARDRICSQFGNELVPS